jgi:hypothetical protein
MVEANKEVSLFPIYTDKGASKNCWDELTRNDTNCVRHTLKKSENETNVQPKTGLK